MVKHLSARWRDTLRTIWRTKSQFLAIIVMTALSAFVFVGIAQTPHLMRESLEGTLVRANMEDVQVASPLGLYPADRETLAKWAGQATIEYRYSGDYFYGNNDILRVLSLPETISRPNVVGGRLPEKPDEILLDALALEDGTFHVGDVITLSEEPAFTGEDSDAAENGTSEDGTSEDGAVEEVSVETENPLDGVGKLRQMRFTVTGFAHEVHYLRPERDRTSMGDGQTDYFALVLPSAFAEDTRPSAALLDVKALNVLATDDPAYRTEEAALISELQDAFEGRPGNLATELKDDANEAIADAEQELADGRKELADAKTELDDAEKELANGRVEYEDGLATFTREIADAEKKLSDAQQTLKDSYETLTQGEADYADGVAQFNDGVAQARDAKQKLDDAKKQLDEGQATLDDGRAQLEDGWAQLTDGQKQIDDGHKELADGQAQLDDGQAQLNAGRVQLQDGQDKLDAGKAQLAAGQQQLDAAQQELDAGKAQIEDGLAKIDEGLAQIDQELPQVIDGIAQIDAGLLKIADEEAQIAAAEALIKAQIEAMEALGITPTPEMLAELEARQQQIATQKAELAAQKQQLEAQKQELVTQKQQMEAQRPQLIAQKAELEAKKLEIAAGQQEIYAQQQTLDANRAEINAQQQTIDEKLAQLEAEQQKINVNQAKINDGLAELEASQEELNASRTTLEEKQKELEDGQKELDANRAEWEKGMAEYEDGQKLLAETRQTLIDSRAKLDDGRSQYEDGLAEWQDGVRELNTERADGQKELDDALADLNQGEKDLAEGKKEYAEEAADAETKFADAEVKIADAKKDIAAIRVPAYNVTGRHDNYAVNSFFDEAASLAALSYVFPAIFYLVAMLVSLTTMMRLVEEERTQIGTLKALGYSRKSISSKYTTYAFLSSSVGSILGAIAGPFVLMPAIYNAYASMLPVVPSADFELKLRFYVMAVAISLAVVLIAAWASVNNSLKEKAAELMRPKPPANGNRILLERIPFIWSHLSFMKKVTMRNLTAKKSRMFMTILGIAGCAGLITMGFGISNSVTSIVEKQFTQLQTYNLKVVYDAEADAPDVEAVFDYLEDKTDGYATAFDTSGTFINKKGVTEAYEMYVPTDEAAFRQFIAIRDRKTGEDVTLSDAGALISEKMAEGLNTASTGQANMRDVDGFRLTLPVERTIENYVNHVAFVSTALYEEAYGEAPVPNIILTNVDIDVQTAAEELLKLDAVTAVMPMDDVTDIVGSLTESLKLIVLVIILVSSLLALVVLFNLTNLNVSERLRELSTIKVLGFRSLEVTEYIYRETFALTIVGILIGMAVGKGIHYFIVGTLAPSAVMLDPVLNIPSYLIAAGLTLLFSLFIMGYIHVHLKRVDMVEALKAIE